MADWVIIPTIYGVEELKRALRGIKQVEQLNANIIIVANSMKYGASEVPAEFAQMAKEAATMFRENAPLSAAEGAAVILQGVREERWRILVGDDAHALDAAVREDPEAAYEGAEFLALMREAGGKDPDAQGGALI